MSRPANPAWVIPTWAPNAAYPSSADPWSTTATKVPHPGAASVGFTPKAGVAAQCVNQNFSDAFATDQTAKSYVGSVVDWTGNAPALTFHDEVSIVNRLTMKYSAALRKWLSAGGTDGFERTGDILLWPGVTEIPVPQRDTRECYDFDVDPSGNIVVIPDGIDAVQECNAAGTWALQLAVFGGLAFATGNVVYDAFSGRWIAMSQQNAVAPPTIASTDRVTWAPLTPPALSGSSIPTLGSGSTNLAGNIVVQGFNGTNVQFSHSADGGTTWSAPQTFALGFTQYAAIDRYPKPVWNGSYWLAVAFSSGTASKVFKSTDGITWTNVATFANAQLVCLSAIGELWIAVTSGGEQLVSTDGGATWRWCDRKISTGGPLINLVAANGMRFVVTSGAKIYPGGTAFGSGLAAAT